MKRWLFLIPLFASSLAFAACGEQFVDGKGDCVSGITADSGGTTTGETITLDGTGGIVTTRSGNTIAIDGSGVASPPGGSTTQVQYNDGGAFGGDSYFDYNETSNRLSVFTTIGTETVTNGTFASNANGWTVPSGMAYSSSSVSKTSNGTGALTQTFNGYQQREYLLTYTLSSVTAGTVTPSVAGFTGTTQSAACDVSNPCTERFVATATTQLAFTPSNTARFTIDNISIKPLKGTNTASNINTGGLSIEGEWSNGSPGTTRPMTINNDGSYSWIDYRFGGVLKAASVATSSGELGFYSSGGNYAGFYYGSSGLTSGSLYSYNYPTAFVHSSGYGAFNTGVHAGATSAPTSTLQTAGSTALQVARITSSQSIDGTATIILSDATTASACTGTPSTTTCSSYTGSGQATCESHLPCAWNAGTSCTVYNNESGMGTCAGTSGCSADTSACAGGDESTCLASDDSYGGSCSWGWNDCSALNEGTCGSTTGCTQNYSDCSTFNDNYSGCTGQSGCTSSSSTDCAAFDGTDQGTCEGNTGCTWDGMSSCYMTCSGTYYTSCSGTYYTCSGTYYTGNCSGTYGTACSGTVLCSSYGSSGPCGSETGCTWSSVLNLTLPNGESSPHRNYWIYNDATGGADTVIYPYSGQTVNETTSYTLAAYRDWVHFAYYKQTKDCSVYGSAGACTPTGCSITYANCSWDGMTDCSGDSACDAGDNTDSMTCTAITYFSSCSGTEIIRKNWYKVGS